LLIDLKFDGQVYVLPHQSVRILHRDVGVAAVVNHKKFRLFPLARPKESVEDLSGK
jgi:hypothetical protein